MAFIHTGKQKVMSKHYHSLSFSTYTFYIHTKGMGSPTVDKPPIAIKITKVIPLQAHPEALLQGDSRFCQDNSTH